MARRVIALHILLVGTVGACASPAFAGGTLTPAGAPLVASLQDVAGPSFAGDRVAWGVPRGRENIDVHVSDGGSETVQHVHSLGGGLPGPGVVRQTVAASPSAIALAVNVQRCYDESQCKYMQFNTEESSVHAGPLGGPLSFTDDCVTDNAAVDLSGSELAYVSNCAGGAIVRDLSAPPGSPWRGFPAVYGARIAGDFLAVDQYESGADTIAVYNWRTGQRLYELPRPARAGAFDIQDDGTIGFARGIPPTRPTAYELDWASPAEPFPHRIASVVNPSNVRIADSKVALRDGLQVRVFDLTGTEVASTSAREAIGSLDFDGRRLAMATQPCEEAAIVTWDLAGQPPRLPDGACPNGKLAERVSVADLRHRRLEVRARCPSVPALGCTGFWFVRFARAGIDTLGRYLALAPGGKVTLRLRLARAQACKLGRVGLGGARVWLQAVYTKRDPARGGVLTLKLRRVGRPTDCH